MATWQVTLRREITETCEAVVEVEADSEEEALTYAVNLANEGRVAETEWSSESSETSSLEATQAECLTQDEENEDDGEEVDG